MWTDILLPHMFVHHVQTGPKEARKGTGVPKGCESHLNGWNHCGLREEQSVFFPSDPTLQPLISIDFYRKC